MGAGYEPGQFWGERLTVRYRPAGEWREVATLCWAVLRKR